VKDKYKTKEQLISELINLRQKIAELEEIETEQRRVEEALLESEEKFRLVFENAKDAIFWANPVTGLIINCNKAAETLLEKRKEEIIGHNQTMLHPPQKAEYFVNMFKKHIVQKEAIDDEAEVITKSGEIKPVHITASITFIRGEPIIQGIFRDIAERQRAEGMLLKEKSFTDSAINSLPGIFYLFDENGRLLRWNRNLEIISGYSDEEISKMNPLDVFAGEEKKLAEDAIREVFIKGESNVEANLISKDGRKRPYFFTGLRFVSDNQNYLVGMGIDITERKRAEEALLESKEKFRAISNTAVDAILVIDDEGRILYWNPAAERMFGYRADEAMGKELHLFLAPDRYREDYKKGFSKFKKTGQGPAVGVTSEFFALRKDGIEFPMEVSTSAIQIAGKWHAVGIVRDITERKLAERALRESEQNYSSLFKESKDVVYISTPEGKFLDINPAGVELFGYTSKEELLQINIPRDLYVHPVDREKFQNILAKQGYVKDFEVTFKKKDGEKVTVLLTSNLVRDEKDNIMAYRGIMKDITERKHLEEQLLQAQKMEAIGQLAGGIAHDFNNILTAIIGFGTLLKIETSKDDLLRGYVTQILNSAERAANLTQALLAFGRKQIINLKPVNLNEIINVLEKLLVRLIGEDIELSIFLTDKDLIVMADSTQIEQVLMNLATNARDAMPDGGSLIIRTGLMEVDYEFIKTHGFGRPGSYAFILFEDTGQGMDERTKERIFEPFFTTKEVGKGTGLGLSMVYGIIKQHEGYITVYSEHGKGTTFRIYLPLIKSKIEETEPADLSILKGGLETVLIAEDDAHVRELTKNLLERFGYKVIDAVDGEDALIVFNENKDNVHLLILDVIMPKKNGKEVYDEIKKVRPDIKAIFISGYASDIIYKKGILEEGTDVILKPLSPQELLKKAREMLDK